MASLAVSKVSAVFPRNQSLIRVQLDHLDDIMPKVDAETEAMQKELSSLADKCREEQKKARDSGDVGTGSSIPKAKASCRKVLKGHINKVTCVHFSGDSRHAVSGSLDGKLIVWDCYTGNKTMVSLNLDARWCFLR